ncbi:hypothetical protein MTO96_028248 [Rhipicephalus appendiculatus]
MVFTNGNSKDFLQSFSFPFFTMSNLGLEQPIFGANYIKGTVKAEQNGNWTGKCTFKLKFMKGGAIEFGQAMMEAGKTASQHAAGMAPPAVLPPLRAPTTAPPPPAYTPGQGVDYGFNIPYNVFPDAPPANSVFMSDMPPPIPGLVPHLHRVSTWPDTRDPLPHSPPGPISRQQPWPRQPRHRRTLPTTTRPTRVPCMYRHPPPSFDQANASAPPEGPPPPYSEGSKKTN